MITFGAEQIKPQEVLVLAEFTTADGPACDDYFLWLTTHDGRTFEKGIGGPDTGKMIEEYSAALGVRMELRLFNRSDYSSRVLYPPPLQGLPLFTYKRTEFPRGRVARLLRFPDHVDEWVPDPDILERARRWNWCGVSAHQEILDPSVDDNAASR